MQWDQCIIDFVIISNNQCHNDMSIPIFLWIPVFISLRIYEAPVGTPKILEASDNANGHQKKSTFVWKRLL